MTTTRPVRRTLTRLALSLTVVTLLGGALVVGDALQAPGDDQPTAKLAEWGRDHGLNPVVTWLEAAQYEQAPPEVGGLPPGGVPAAAGAVTPTTGAPSASTPASRFPHPAPVPALPPLAAGPALPGEGQWQTVVAFHGGFRLSDPSHNGYFSEGRTVRPLVDGKASLVLHTDGTADVGTWGTESGWRRTSPASARTCSRSSTAGRSTPRAPRAARPSGAAPSARPRTSTAPGSG
ncbi:MAG: hypothetical protein J0I49_32525 [Pseudonocardia sp.]|uniref:hypothetical protein n=1 Tax=Pseudonocardia sp. TaxID=60912 RepID=UPI001AC62642|nr:hypothetical protein [Pseudonocardia sp.]MBN9102786.1 hypothetical protein [Pseudonocardia sp.]